MGRLVKFVARKSKAKKVELPDGTIVKKDQEIELDARLAHELLRAPGATDDSEAEWIPVAR